MRRKKGSRCALQSQMEEILSESRTPDFHLFQVDANILFRTPNVDHRHAAPRRVLAVVNNINSPGLCKVCTKEGILVRLYGKVHREIDSIRIGKFFFMFI